MRNNETGEFELVVGNRQLLSGFFIVVLLFAVAFAMGYVVGQNSPRTAKAGVETAAATTTPPATDGRPQPAPNPPAPAPQEPATAPTETAAPPSTAAARQPDTPPQPDSKATKEPAKEPAKAPERPTTAADIPMLAELPGPPGSFWQVVALDQQNAEVIAGALKKKGFNAFLSPGTKGLFRVMVGPYADTAAMGKAKTDLASAGFNSPIRK
jgi:cell division septation protein DedD